MRSPVLHLTSPRPHPQPFCVPACAHQLGLWGHLLELGAELCREFGHVLRNDGPHCSQWSQLDPATVSQQLPPESRRYTWSASSPHPQPCGVPVCAHQLGLWGHLLELGAGLCGEPGQVLQHLKLSGFQSLPGVGVLHVGHGDAQLAGVPKVTILPQGLQQAPSRVLDWGSGSGGCEQPEWRVWV